MDISDSHRPEQEELFYSLAPKMFGDAVLVSHAIVRQWDSDNPMTLSAAGLGRLRKRLPDTLLVSDCRRRWAPGRPACDRSGLA
jgi:beta-N-acetylhexosaminidase